MKQNLLILTAAVLLASSCTSQKKLAYLNNLPESGEETIFPIDIPEYKIQQRDILYITVKAMTSDGRITDFLSSGTSNNVQMDASGGFLSGYVVDTEGNILIPVVGTIKVAGSTIEEVRKILQSTIEKVFRNSTVECKLQSFKFTVIGEVITPGTFINYSNYLTVFEAIGRAGGLSDIGNRQKILVIRPIENTTKTFTLNLQDKEIITSEAYFLLPNDVIIVQPTKQKIFNLNTPTFSFVLSTIASSISTTLLLILFFQK